MAAVAAPLFERGPLSEVARASGPFSLNVKLPGRQDPERAHLTRFQSKAPPQLMGEMVAVSCTGSDTVAKLKEAVGGELQQFLQRASPNPDARHLAQASAR